MSCVIPYRHAQHRCRSTQTGVRETHHVTLVCVVVVMVRISATTARLSTSQGSTRVQPRARAVERRGRCARTVRAAGGVNGGEGKDFMKRAFERARGMLENVGGRTGVATSGMKCDIDAPTWGELERMLSELPQEPVDDDASDASASERLFGTTSTPRVKLYRDSASWCPYSQKIWMQLEEKRIPYVKEKINMRCYGLKPESFMKIAPSGALPVIELDGQVISESSVIARVIEDEFPEHKPLLPYAPGSAEGERARYLMQMERALFGRWMQWITSSWSDGSGYSAYSEVLDSVDAELGSGGGPYFMGSDFTMVDIAFAPFLERMASSILYYKGVKIEGNGGRWPHLDSWFAAMANRKTYRGIKSDYYTTAHDLPPQLGGCAENGDNVSARDAIDGVDGVNWRLPLGPLNEKSLEPWWGSDDPVAARIEAARKIVSNHTNVVRFAARGCGEPGKPSYSAPLSDPNARPGEAHIPAVDAALRCVVHAMLQPDVASVQGPAKNAGMFDADATSLSLAYLRDRVGVPRDMSYPAARQFRAYLNWAIERL